jgi:hypothetical protein
MSTPQTHSGFARRKHEIIFECLEFQPRSVPASVFDKKWGVQRAAESPNYLIFLVADIETLKTKERKKILNVTFIGGSMNPNSARGDPTNYSFLMIP